VKESTDKTIVTHFCRFFNIFVSYFTIMLTKSERDGIIMMAASSKYKFKEMQL